MTPVVWLVAIIPIIILTHIWPTKSWRDVWVRILLVSLTASMASVVGGKS